MRVLLVVPNVVSLNNFFTELVAALIDRGIQVHAACSPDATWKESGTSGLPVRVHSIAFPRGFNALDHAKSARQLGMLVSTIQPDIVHSHFSSAIFTTAIAKTSHWPITIGTFQGLSAPLVPGARGRILRLAETWSASRIDGAWVLTSDDLHFLVSSVPGGKFYQQSSLGFGCDLRRFDPSRFSIREKARLRSSLGFDPGNRVLAFLGRFVHFKGFAQAVRAFSALAETIPEARLLLIGARDPLHPTGLAPFEEEAMSKSRQIVDLGWQVEVEKYLVLADALIFPSVREGMPVCLMEALSLGIPVITYDSRGCREVVRDGIDGFALKDRSVEALVYAMRRIMNETELRAELSTNAVNGRKRFDRSKYVGEQVNIYERLLKAKATTSGEMQA